jgi:hypothetical protein
MTRGKIKVGATEDMYNLDIEYGAEYTFHGKASSVFYFHSSRTAIAYSFDGHTDPQSDFPMDIHQEKIIFPNVQYIHCGWAVDLEIE